MKLPFRIIRDNAPADEKAFLLLPCYPAQNG